MRFEFTRDEIATLINALYIYRENVKAKMIKSKTESGRKVTARVLERVNNLYVFFVGEGHAKKDF